VTVSLIILLQTIGSEATLDGSAGAVDSDEINHKREEGNLHVDFNSALFPNCITFPT
jgi:uncharacterized protein (DUF1684 family)